jgi:AMMECR1 domain-containing protein
MVAWSLGVGCLVRIGDGMNGYERLEKKNDIRTHTHSPLFVTWNVRSSRPGRSHRLRGCIGSFEPHALHEGIAEYALISALKDHRFNKITKGELDSLECV